LALSLLSGCGGPSTTPQSAPKGTQASTTSEVASGGHDPGAPSAPDLPAHLRAAVAHPARPEDDRARDADRKPAQVLDFFGIEPGMHVAELMAGRGYYTEILSRALGPGGKLHVHNTEYVLDKFARGPITERLQRLETNNTVEWHRPLDDLDLPKGELDAVLLILFYHDTYWMDVDRHAMNAQLYDALEPGGIYGVVDHHARDGAGASRVKDIHRIEHELVLEEIRKAGFVLEARSALLRHPEDNRTTDVFDPSIRGETDRFIYRFRKPADASQ
jgi:predicted methyltransferase